MKQLLLPLALLGTTIYAADDLRTWFAEGSVSGNVKYYYIETQKENPGTHTSAHANSVGGKLHYETGDFNGLKTGVTFMTTNGFALSGAVDTSILARDNGVRIEGSASGDEAKSSFSVLGEAYLEYSMNDLTAGYGRRVMKSPLIDAKEVRMLPSAVQGAYATYAMPYGTTLSLSYLTHFKQRTSDRFINIVEHALGTQTETITGSAKQDIAVFSAVYSHSPLKVSLYDYYATDFLNSFYADASYKGDLNSDYSYGAGIQFINQRSVGNADDNLAQAGSATGGKAIRSNAVAIKGAITRDESTIAVAASKVYADGARHDALVLPWDGTPLFTNTITSNNLFQSNYGSGLKSDSLYIGGSLGIKASYNQGYDFAGLKGLKTSLAYLTIDNERFANKQRDINAVLSYATGDFSIALKGIWVKNNTAASADGTISQTDRLTQYRVIANYNW